MQHSSAFRSAACLACLLLLASAAQAVPNSPSHNPGPTGTVWSAPVPAPALAVPLPQAAASSPNDHASQPSQSQEPRAQPPVFSLGSAPAEAPAPEEALDGDRPTVLAQQQPQLSLDDDPIVPIYTSGGFYDDSGNDADVSAGLIAGGPAICSRVMDIFMHRAHILASNVADGSDCFINHASMTVPLKSSHYMHIFLALEPPVHTWCPTSLHACSSPGTEL